MEVGPHNVYNIYDNCPRTSEYLKQHNSTMRQLLLALRSRFNTQDNDDLTSSSQLPLDEHHPDGGYTWSCGGMDAWMMSTRDDVMQNPSWPGRVRSRTRHPASIRSIRACEKDSVFIYSGMPMRVYRTKKRGMDPYIVCTAS